MNLTHLVLLISLIAIANASCKEGVQTASTPSTSSPQRVTVFAAASTADVMTEIAQLFESRNNGSIVIEFSFDASSNLARQIKAGAPAHIYLSADSKWMDDVEAAGLLQAESREQLLGNSLVLIAPRGQGFPAPEMNATFNFALQLPQVQRLALADPTHVPAGRYARQALEHFGWWTMLEPKILPAQDVRAALRLVERGEADAGIVYATDAAASTLVERIVAFPPSSHEPIRYPLALLTNATAEAEAFIEFLRTPEAADRFMQHGFTVLEQSQQSR